MKKGWQTKHLGDVAAVGAGNSAPQDEALFEDGTIPFFRTADAGRVRFGDIAESTDYLNDKGVKGLRRFAAGTILFPKSGASTFLNHRVILGVEGCVSSHLATIVADEKQAHPRFLLYFLSTIEAQDLVQDHAYPSLNLPTIAGIEVHLPPLAEQQRIVGLLDEAFEGLATAKANAEKNLQNARALFESHLQSVFTQRGPGWVGKSLVDVCTFINGRAYKKDEMLSTGKYPLLRVGNFFTNRGWYYSDFELDADKYCDNGDLLYAWSASFGPRVWDGGKVIYHYHIWKVLPHEKVVEKRFLLHLLEWDVDEIKKAHGTGTTMMHVSKGSMEYRVVPIPPLKDQAAIVLLLDSLRKETQRLATLYERKQAALAALKQSLLHQAFTGEL